MLASIAIIATPADICTLAVFLPFVNSLLISRSRSSDSAAPRR